MIELLQREIVYLWYYFTVQLEQIFVYWVMGMVLGSAISVFAKEKVYALFGKLQGQAIEHTGFDSRQPAGYRFTLMYVWHHSTGGILFEDGDER